MEESPLRCMIISVGSVSLEAELWDTLGASALWNALPLEAPFNKWGDEFYFTIPIAMELDSTATTDVNIGDIGYWPPGQALAIFFGSTPASTGPKPVPASAVNKVGRIIGDATVLRRAASARKIRLEKSTPQSLA